MGITYAPSHQPLKRPGSRFHWACGWCPLRGDRSVAMSLPVPRPVSRACPCGCQAWGFALSLSAFRRGWAPCRREVSRLYCGCSRAGSPPISPGDVRPHGMVGAVRFSYGASGEVGWWSHKEVTFPSSPLAHPDYTVTYHQWKSLLRNRETTTASGLGWRLSFIMVIQEVYFFRGGGRSSTTGGCMCPVCRPCSLRMSETSL